MRDPRILLLMMLCALVPQAPPAAGQAPSQNITPALPARAAPAAIGFAKPGAGLEAAISGAAYRLGPGDSLAINVWAPQPVQLSAAVNVEGKLVLPGVGELGVDGMLLDEARRRIVRALMANYHDVEITISLMGLRRFQVHILGQVDRPGTYLGTAADRVSAAVAWAGGLSADASERRITVSNGGRPRAEADLFRFLRRGQMGGNPLLRDGDIIYVPYARHRIYVRGAVNEGGAFEFLPGDRFCDALGFAGGFTPEVFPDTIEVARYLGPDRNPVRFFVTAGGDIVPARAVDEEHLPAVQGRCTHQEIEYPDFALQADDEVFVRAIPEYRVKRLVRVRGEVRYPGWYPISEGESRLREILTRAGGITPEAFLREATLVRTEAIRLEDKEFERLKEIPPADMTEDEYEYFKLRSRENPGLMVVDFHRLLVNGDDSQDIFLRGGDEINIPRIKDFISVLGMVRAPGNILYESSYTAKDYLAKAGGYAETADRGKTRVIKAVTGEWVSLDEVDDIEPGDTIWVPEKPDREWWALFKDVIAVTTQIVTIYLVVDRAVSK